MKREALLILAAILFITFGAWSASAQLIADPAGITEVGRFDAGGMLMRSTIEYEEEEISRTIVGAYGIYGLNDYIDVYGSLGISAMVEPEGWDENGRGFIVAGGVRGFIWGSGPLSIYGYGQLQYLSEDYGEYSESYVEDGVTQEATIEADATLVELVAGAMAEYSVSEQFKLYGGLELVPYSDGEAESSVDYNVDVEETGYDIFDDYVDAVGDSLDYSESGDVKRDTPVTVRAGAKYNMGGWWLRGEIALGGETAFGIGGGVTF